MNVNEAGYWNERYHTGNTGWDIGYVSTPVREYVDQLTDKNIRILIPGSGNSYEAEYLLDKGFTDITLIDLSSVLTAKLKEKFREKLPGEKIITGNFFDHTGQYDLIIEQTFFCAIDPSMRREYVQHVYKLLKPGGKLAGVLFDRNFEGGPPFGGSLSEYRNLFAERFKKFKIEPCYNSIPPRKGTEVFIIVEK